MGRLGSEEGCGQSRVCSVAGLAPDGVMGWGPCELPNLQPSPPITSPALLIWMQRTLGHMGVSSSYGSQGVWILYYLEGSWGRAGRKENQMLEDCRWEGPVPASLSPLLLVSALGLSPVHPAGRFLEFSDAPSTNTGLAEPGCCALDSGFQELPAQKEECAVNWLPSRGQRRRRLAD
jgi:hypothetical protein